MKFKFEFIQLFWTTFTTIKYSRNIFIENNCKNISKGLVVYNSKTIAHVFWFKNASANSFLYEKKYPGN